MDSFNNSSTPVIIGPNFNSLAFWAKFMGVMSIISGAFTCLGIITAIIGIPVIIAGARLYSCGNNIKQYAESNDTYSLSQFLINITSYLKINGIMAIIGICLFIVYIVVIIVALAAGASFFSSGFSSF